MATLVKSSGATEAADEMIVRGEPIPPQSVEHGYDQNWYPIALSTDVEAGEIYGTEFMNGRVIVVRDENGTPQVLSAYCRHLGADLKDGAMVEGKVRCPFHHWDYNAEGQCVATAVGDKAPARAKLFRFPTQESIGFVWAFNGVEPLYDLPHFPVPEDELELKVEFEQLVTVDHFVPFSNSSDIQHLRSVHQIDLSVNPEGVEVTPHGMRYAQTMNIPGMGPLEQHVTIFGTNCLIFETSFMGRLVYQMSAGKALPGNRTLASMMVATPKSTGEPGEDEMIDNVLEQAMNFGRTLFEEDDIVMSSISFRQDILTPADRQLSNFLAYVRKYPRTTIACDMIG